MISSDLFAMNIAKEDMDKLKELDSKCKASKDKSDCKAHMDFYKEVLKRSLKAQSETTVKTDTPQTNPSQSTGSESKDDKQEQQDMLIKIDQLAANSDIDQLKSLCFSGEKYACGLIDRVQRKIDSKAKREQLKAKADAKAAKKKVENLTGKDVLAVVKSIKVEGVNISSSNASKTSVRIKGTYETFKALNTFLTKYKDARYNKLKLKAKDKAWKPQFSQDPEDFFSGFIIEFSK